MITTKLHCSVVCTHVFLLNKSYVYVLAWFSHVPLYVPDSSVHGILQARILEWVAMPSSRGSSQLRDRTCPSHIYPALAGMFFTTSTTWEAQVLSLDADKLLVESIFSTDNLLSIPIYSLFYLSSKLVFISP